jgi:hypothetical protein
MDPMNIFSTDSKPSTYGNEVKGQSSFGLAWQKMQAFFHALRWSQLKRRWQTGQRKHSITKGLAVLAIAGAGVYLAQVYWPQNQMPQVASAQLGQTVSQTEEHEAPSLSSAPAAKAENIKERLKSISAKAKAQYLKRFERVAESEAKKFKLPKNIILGLAILSSEFGQHELAQAANNHFGLACQHNLLEEDLSKPLQKGQACFSRYTKAWSSFRAISLYLSSPAFEELAKLAGKDHNVWATGLEKLGYEAPNFSAENLTFVIEQYL